VYVDLIYFTHVFHVAIHITLDTFDTGCGAVKMWPLMYGNPDSVNTANFYMDDFVVDNEFNTYICARAAYG
jgi:hypothetical protein